ncbi:MAG TPA: hypothetical protein VFV85_10095 [Conexibacter sp.]|nr:hypothetical protein [Conexibacter sp.]
MLALESMTVRTRPHRPKSRPRIALLATRRAPNRVAEAEQPPTEARERAAGGPEDRASYRCACGCVFEASVSTTVGCPHCGDTQAW